MVVVVGGTVVDVLDVVVDVVDVEVDVVLAGEDAGSPLHDTATEATQASAARRSRERVLVGDEGVMGPTFWQPPGTVMRHAGSLPG